MLFSFLLCNDVILWGSIEACDSIFYISPLDSRAISQP